MVEDDLFRDGVSVVDFIVLVRESFPWLWYRRLQSLFSDIEQISVIRQVHPKELGVANYFYMYENDKTSASNCVTLTLLGRLVLLIVGVLDLLLVLCVLTHYPASRLDLNLFKCSIKSHFSELLHSIQTHPKIF